MRFQPAYQSMINRRFNDRVSCPARKSPKQALACKPRIYSPASGKGGHESGVSSRSNRMARGNFMRRIEMAGYRCHRRSGAPALVLVRDDMEIIFDFLRPRQFDEELAEFPDRTVRVSAVDHMRSAAMAPENCPIRAVETVGVQ